MGRTPARNRRKGVRGMRAVVQRVTSADVKIDGEVKGKIDNGFMVLLGVGNGDTAEDMKYIADKIINLRVFSDENDKMNLSLADVGGSMLVISQFTLYGDYISATQWSLWARIKCMRILSPMCEIRAYIPKRANLVRI